jgi:hypothetical protein
MAVCKKCKKETLTADMSIWKTKKGTFKLKAKCSKCKKGHKVDIPREEVILLAKKHNLELQYERGAK